MGWNLDGKCIVITGAARGIGAAVAEALAGRGARVALIGLEPDRLREVAGRVGGVWFEADVTDPVATSRAVEAAAARLGGIDAVFANAGIANFSPLLTMPPAQMRRVIEVNVLGVFHAVQAALPHIIERKGYVLINASVAAAVGPPCFGAYAASKAAAEAMGDVLRQEVRHHGVDVGVCYFGFIATDMVRGADEHPAFREVRKHLPPPVHSTTPLSKCVDGVVKGFQRRTTRVIVPGGLRAILPLRWALALASPRMAAGYMADVERLCAESDAAFGGVTPTTEKPEDLLGPSTPQQTAPRSPAR